MPNWCHNELTVWGPMQDLKDFVEKTKGKPDEDGKVEALSLAALIPEPSTDIRNLPAPVPEGVYDWYTWRINNWGTKWDLADVRFVVAPVGNEVSYGFESAWSPPVFWLSSVCRQFPTLHFTLTYSEPGAAFRGKAKAYWQDGVFEDRSEAYEPGPDEWC